MIGGARRAAGALAAAILALTLAVLAPTADAAFPGENGRILYHEGVPDTSDRLFSVLPDGSEPLNLSGDSDGDLSGAWSPDGKSIVFSSQRGGGTPQIYVMSADGTAVSGPLTAGDTNLEPTWSPDGTQIAFVSDRDGLFQVFVMNADGSMQTKRTNFAGDVRNPSWSPDGELIAVDSDERGNPQIYVVPADGEGVPVRLSSSDSDEFDPNWSPDGSLIAFVSNRDDQNEIYVMNANGTEPRNLTGHSARDTSPAFSPDGTKIVFASMRSTMSRDLYVLDVAGGEAEQLTETSPPNEGSPDWQPLARGEDPPPDPPTFVVSTAADEDDGTCDTAHCALREAIQAANAAGGGKIHFDIAPGGHVTIELAAPLPDVAGTTTIDGTTQPGEGDAPRIELNGADAGEAAGLRLVGSGSVIRGLTLNNFAADGIALLGGGGHAVERSFVGTTADGMEPSRNSGWGILVSSGSNRIGVHGAWPPNVVSGNGAGGILITGDGNAVLDNRIGSGLSDTVPVPNDGPGIQIASGATGNEIGSDADGGPGNRIAFNGGAGVEVVGAETQGNAIVRNSIDANGGLGIDLGGDGVTPNDEDDADEGPNRLQNFPVIDSAVREESWTRITGSLRSTPLTAFWINWYVSDACDPSDHGEGAIWAGRSLFSTNADGVAEIDTETGITFPASPGQFVTATAADPDGNTSEFSLCVVVEGAAVTSFVVTTTEDADDGACTIAHCTLREAIDAANATPGRDTIGFSIGFGGDQTISLDSPLPEITDPVVINGFTQPREDESDRPLIELDGSGAGEADGLVVLADGVEIRGLVVNRFSGAGIVLDGGNAIVVGNYVGTNAFGDAGAGNAGAGISIRTSVGHTLRHNVVSSNGGNGIEEVNETFADGTAMIFGNLIGVGADGSIPLGNKGHGVFLRTSDFAFVGDDGSLPLREPGSPNTIAHNAGAGVYVESGFGNRIVANSMHSNGGLGIDLAPAGVTPNDPEDGDEGANRLQNFPEIEAVTFAEGSSDHVNILATVDAHSEVTFRIDYYASAECDPSGHGEGARHLGGDLAPADGGLVSFDSSSVGPVTPGEVITATVTDHQGNTSEFSACATVASDAEAVLELVADADSVPAGAGRVRLEDVPATAVFGRESDLAAAPLANIPLANIPLANIDLRHSPLANIPLANIGFASVMDGPLGDVALSSIPLTTPGGWEALLQGTIYADVPLQTVTLRDVYSLPAAELAAIESGLTLGQIGLSGSRAGSTPLVALGLGATPLANIPLANIGLSLGDLCTALAGPPVNCTDPADLAPQSILGLTLQGAPLANIPLANIPLANIPLANIPLANIPLANIPLANIPLANIPLANIDIAGTPLANIPLANIPLANIPLANIPLANIPLANIPLANIPLANIPLANIDAVVDCAAISCTGTLTLGDALAAGALRPDATLGDLAGAFGDIVLGDVWPELPATLADVWEGLLDTTLGDLWPILPAWVTLGDVLLLFLAPDEFPWERISFDAFDPALYATGGATLGYSATFTVSGGPAVGTVRVKVKLPSGFGYVAGSARLEEVAVEGEVRALDDPAVDGSTLEFDLDDVARGTGYRLVVDARPSIVLGFAAAEATAQPLGGAETAESRAEAEVTDTFEPNDDPDTAPELADDSFYLSFVTSRADVDYFRFPIPAAGHRIVVRLSHLPGDYDLAVYGPPRLESPRDSGEEGIPLDGVPLADDGAGFDALQKALAPEALDDVPLLRDRPLWGLSINRGTTDEDVAVVSDGETGFYTIQVSGYNGASSANPYMLRVQVVEPRVLPECVAPRSFPHAGTPGALPATLPAGLNTVFVVNEERLRATYGAAADVALGAIADNLDDLEALGFPSALVPVEGDTDAAAAYAAWDADPCSPHRANAVVRAVGDVLDDIRTQRPTLRYVVLVGGDDIVPHARIDDVTTFANELEYASTFGSVNSQYLGAFGNGKLLTDNPYGTTAPIPFFNRHLYVPSLQVGRLVETPADIAKAVGQFVDFDGRLDPQTSFTTGYDFLSDGAEEIHDHLSQLVPGATSLISETWTSADVESALLGPDAPGIASVNAHYDHHRSLPAAPHAAGSEQDLFTIEQVRSAPPDTLAGRILFTMGCHAGLSLADVVIGTTAEPGDWAQAFAEQGALFAGNTGFGLGDTEVVAYTERLLALFAEELGSASTIAEALNRAKHRYVALQGVFGVYDEKVMAQMTLYGLPMYGIGAAAPAPPPPAAIETEPDPLTGIDSSAFGVDLDPAADFELRTGARGSYYAVAGGDFQVTHFRPIQPRLHLPAQEGAHGALVTALESVDDTGFDPVFSRPIVDHASREPEISFGEVSFPTKIQTIGRGPDGESLVLVVGQFFTDGDGGGVQRRWTNVEGLVYSSASSDYVPPALRRVEGVRLGPHVSFLVDVEDAEGPVKRVYVLYRDETGWHGIDLAHTGGASWTGGGPAALSDPDAHVEYFVQAVDAAGNVAVSTRKGEYYDAGPPPAAPPGLTIGLDGTAGEGGWFRSPVSVTLDGPAGATLEVSVDGGPFTRYAGAFQVSGDGVHVVSVRGPDGLFGTFVVPIDTTSPSIVIVTPADGGVYRRGDVVPARYVCLDTGSGAAECTGTVAAGAPIDTAAGGTKTFTVSARDAAGNAPVQASASYVVSAPPNVTITCPSGPVLLGSFAVAPWTAEDAGSGLSTPASGEVVLDTSTVGTKTATTPVAKDDYISEATASCEYRVIYDFKGFFPPVANPPTLNVVNAGRAIPIKFSLNGDQGLQILESGYPRSGQIACDDTAPALEVEETTTAGSSTLIYDAKDDQYVYVWATSSAWKGTCRQFVLKLVDGTVHRANFRFR